MTNQSLLTLERAIRRIYSVAPAHAQAAAAIEDYLEREMETLPMPERLALLERIEQVFGQAGASAAGNTHEDFLRDLVPLLLGGHVRPADLTGPELVRRLAQALDTVFSQLNELIGIINTALGGSPNADETIRHVIGDALESTDRTRSIEEHLGQIRTAFLTARQASQEAARTIAGFILTELDPRAMDAGAGGFKLGAFKKSEAFDLFEEKYGRVRKWFDSERFLVDFLRQFEKQCQNMKGGAP